MTMRGWGGGIEGKNKRHFALREAEMKGRAGKELVIDNGGIGVYERARCIY